MSEDFQTGLVENVSRSSHPSTENWRTTSKRWTGTLKKHSETSRKTCLKNLSESEISPAEAKSVKWVPSSTGIQSQSGLMANPWFVNSETSSLLYVEENLLN